MMALVKQFENAMVQNGNERDRRRDRDTGRETVRQRKREERDWPVLRSKEESDRD
jgi:hypothetical protein